MYWWGQWNATSGFIEHIVKFFKNLFWKNLLKILVWQICFYVCGWALAKAKRVHSLFVENVSYFKRACAHLWTRDGGAKTPCFGGQLKYLTPPTDPSFLPLGLSSSIPNQSPGKTKTNCQKGVLEKCWKYSILKPLHPDSPSQPTVCWR